MPRCTSSCNEQVQVKLFEKTNTCYFYRFQCVTLVAHTISILKKNTRYLLNATRSVVTGTILCLPLTPVDSGLPGFPTGTFALSSQKKSITSSFISTDLHFKYFKIAAQ